MLKLIASSDIHSPKWTGKFLNSLNKVGDFDLLVLAGDLADRGGYKHLYPIFNQVKEKKCVAVFGNEDFQQYRESYKKEYPGVTWLDDSSILMDFDSRRVLIVGSDGVLQRSTRFQQLMGIDSAYYKRKLERIEELLCQEADVKILVTHYASSMETVFGERESVYPFLGYPIVEKVKCPPDIAIHGHAHYSKRTFYSNGRTKIYNVALPANGNVVTISI